MAGPIIDVLEVIAVEHRDAERASLVLSTLDLAIEELLQPAPVHEAC